MTIPDTLPGHWDSAAGAEMAREYAGMTRAQLCGGDLTDSNVAFRTAMLGRNQLDHEAVLTVAKDRIRWLSVQLALSQIALNLIAEEGRDDAMPWARGVARAAIAKTKGAA